MAERLITRKRLEFLLENWALYASGDDVGPVASKLCGSAERGWAKDASRYVWEGRAYVSRGTPDEALPLLVEEVVRGFDLAARQALLVWYGEKANELVLAARLRRSTAMAMAVLDSARMVVWERLEVVCKHAA